MPKNSYPSPTPPDCRESLGVSPAVLAKRDFIKTNPWCPNKSNIEYDRWCDPNNPKTIHYSHIVKADDTIKEILPVTPLMKSRSCKRFGLELYFKVETVHKTGSFHERSAVYALLNLTDEQRQGGVYTASVGNWALVPALMVRENIVRKPEHLGSFHKIIDGVYHLPTRTRQPTVLYELAIAYQAQLLKIQVTIVLPAYTTIDIVSRLQSFGATIVLHGKNIIEAKRRAFHLISEQSGGVGTYLNGYDNPNVIAAAGSIGIEVVEQLPDAEAVLIPIGGGGLIAGISVAIKHLKPEILIYGVEPDKSCSFFKAMDNERPYQTKIEMGIASSLTIPTAGENAFQTARSLIDKMVLVDDDWTARAILHLVEEEHLIAEGAGAISLGALLSMPNILPELQGKKVVCIISGGNINVVSLTRVLARAKAVEGRSATVTVCMKVGNDQERIKILRVIEHLGCNILEWQTEHEWVVANRLLDSYVTLRIETRDFKHACKLKHVLEKLFPNACEFGDDTFKPKTMCLCYPKKNM